MTAESMSTTDLLRELEQVVETNLNRHLATAKEWFPHEYVPWSQGTDFDGVLGGEAWAPEQSTLSDVARTSLIVNLLTEDNLPSYHHEIATLFGRDGAWGTWVHRWTAEEGRHGIAIRDYLLATRAVDPVALERARMTHMATGFTNAYAEDTALHGIAYVSFQELATRVVAPQHRPHQRRPDLRPAARPGRRGREPAHGVLPQPARRRVRAGAERGDAGGLRRGQDVPDARPRHRELQPQVRADRHGRHLRPAHPPRRGGHAGAAQPEGLRARRACPATGRRPARSWSRSWPSWTGRRPASPSAATRSTPGRPPSWAETAWPAVSRADASPPGNQVKAIIPIGRLASRLAQTSTQSFVPRLKRPLKRLLLLGGGDRSGHVSGVCRSV